MALVLPLAVAAAAATAFTVSKRKPSRLVDAISGEAPAPPSLVSRLTQVPLLNHEQVRDILHIFVNSTPKSEAEQQALAELKRVAIGAGLAVVGFLWYPLQIAGVLCLLPTMAGTFKTALHHLIHERRATGDLLSAVFLAAALGGGLWFPLNVGGLFLVLTKWLAVKTEDQSKQGIIDLFGQQIRSVWLLVDGVEVEVPVERAQPGDRIVIHAGQMAPMDGTIVEGHASIDQHMLTGEAQPAEKGPGDPVLAATIVLTGRITVAVEKAGAATTAAQIGRILTDTSDFKESLVARATEFNDRMALPFLLLGGLTLPFIGLDRALGVLTGTPGYRMVLYGPLSMLSYLHLAAQQGILIKDGRSLELLQEVDTVVFDKTGTLTLDQPFVKGIYACEGFREEAVLAYAAAAETKQSHPIARAILEAAAAQGIMLPSIEDAAYEIGYGIQVRLAGKTILVGSRRFMAMREIALPPTIQVLQEEVHHAGHSLVLVAVDGVLAGAITLQPTLRPEAKTIVQQLRARGLQLYIISGDHDAPTRRLAAELGMDGYFAEVLPEDKADLVKQLQEQGRKVCFVGDGINDSIALKSANVSISLHGATTIAIDTAQIVLMDGNLAQLSQIFTLADAFAANMRVNFLAATVPCIVIIGGALFLGWGLLPSLILYQVSVPFALYNTVRPLLAQKGQIEAKEQMNPAEFAAPHSRLPANLSDLSTTVQPTSSTAETNGAARAAANGSDVPAPTIGVSNEMESR